MYIPAGALLNALRNSLVVAYNLRITLLLALIGTSHLQVLGQSQASGVKYSVASIKLSKPSDPRRRGMEFLPGGRFRAINTPFFQVLATAYNIPWQSIEAIQLRLKGIPDWMFSETYDIEAIADSAPAASGTAVKARNGRIRLMLQSLLADRLRLKLRREMIEVQGYALIVGKGGPKMAGSKLAEDACTESVPFAPITPSGPGCHQIQGGTGRGVHGTAIDMSDLALFVSNWSDRPVVDATGLTKLYAVDTEGWSPSGDDPSRPSLDEVLDRLGLGLTSRKVTIETFVIEHAEKPSNN